MALLETSNYETTTHLTGALALVNNIHYYIYIYNIYNMYISFCIVLQARWGDIVYTTNNSVVLLDDIGDMNNSALQCISDLSGCCLNPGRGQWLYPNGTQVPISMDGYGFYRNRGKMGQVFLRKRSHVTSPTGSYCCQVPTAASGSNDETLYVFLSEFKLW